MSINFQMSLQEGMCYYLFLIRFLLSFPFTLSARIKIFYIMQLEREFVVFNVLLRSDITDNRPSYLQSCTAHRANAVLQTDKIITTTPNLYFMCYLKNAAYSYLRWSSADSFSVLVSFELEACRWRRISTGITCILVLETHSSIFVHLVLWRVLGWHNVNWESVMNPNGNFAGGK